MYYIIYGTDTGANYKLKSLLFKYNYKYNRAISYDFVDFAPLHVIILSYYTIL